MNKEEFIDTLQACYFGDKGAYNKILSLYDENEQLKEKIKALTSKSTSKKIYGEYKHVRLTEKEFQQLIECYGEELTDQLIKYLDEYIEMKGYKAKNHYLCIKKWVVDAVKETKYKYNRQPAKQPIRKEITPEWFDKEVKPEPVSNKEIEEMRELLKEYY